MLLELSAKSPKLKENIVGSINFFSSNLKLEKSVLIQFIQALLFMNTGTYRLIFNIIDSKT